MANVSFCYMPVEALVASESRGGGGMPTGTINTVLQMVNGYRHKYSLGLLGRAPVVHTRVAPGSEHNGLEVGGSPLLTDAVRSNVKRDVAANNSTYKSDCPPHGQIWSQPHFMAGVNIPIVHASAEALGFGGFPYRERSLRGGRKAWERAHGSGNFSGYLSILTKPFLYLAAAPVVMSPFFEPAVWWYVNRLNAKGAREESHPSSEGATSKSSKEPSRNSNDRIEDGKQQKRDEQAEEHHNLVQRLMNRGETTGFTGMKAYGRGAKGTMACSTLESDWDAGIGFTMLSALAVAGALARKPVVKGTNGFETPVCALGGKGLRTALETAGVRISVEVLTTADTAAGGGGGELERGAGTAGGESGRAKL